MKLTPSSNYCRRCGRSPGNKEERSCERCVNETHFENYCSKCGVCIDSVMFSLCGTCAEAKDMTEKIIKKEMIMTDDDYAFFLYIKKKVSYEEYDKAKVNK